MVVRGKAFGELSDQRLILRDEPSLSLALLGPAEGIKGSAPQALALCKKSKGPHHPGAVFLFLQVSRFRIPLGQQRRCQVELQLVVALELPLELLPEGPVGIEPCHLILVLVGHEFEGVARNGFGKAFLSRSANPLSSGCAPDDRAVAICIGAVLIVLQEGRTPFHQFVQRLLAGQVSGGGRGHKPAHRFKIVRRAAAPEEDRKSTRLNSSYVRISYAV